MSFFKKYDFVNTVLPRTNPDFIAAVNKEQEIVERIRAATRYCKDINQIRTNDISKISVDEKASIEKCLHNNFLTSNSDYFGVRETIFIDLN